MPKAHPMMHNAPLDGDCEDKLSALSLSAPEAFSQHTVMAAILALGSNYRAHDYLSQVHQKLRALGSITLSTAFDNPDFTATKAAPKPDYTNQCVYLILSEQMTLQQLQKTLKQFESDCNRQRHIEKTAIKRVTMDIDILLVQRCDDRQWHIMANRYPFKAHECMGLKELTLLTSTKK